MRVVAGCVKIVHRITGLTKVVKTDFVTPVWIFLVRYLCCCFQKLNIHLFVHHVCGLMTIFVIQNLYHCVGRQELHVIMYVHGRSKRSGWSGFGPTTFSLTKRAHAHFENT